MKYLCNIICSLHTQGLCVSYTVPVVGQNITCALPNQQNFITNSYGAQRDIIGLPVNTTAQAV